MMREIFKKNERLEFRNGLSFKHKSHLEKIILSSKHN